MERRETRRGNKNVYACKKRCARASEEEEERGENVCARERERERVREERDNIAEMANT